jgi:hypothetical protein
MNNFGATIRTTTRKRTTKPQWAEAAEREEVDVNWVPENDLIGKGAAEY